MSQKKHGWFALLIAAVILAALFASFGLSNLLRSKPSITLPDFSSSAQPTDSAQISDPSDDDSFLPVDVTPKTVQEVIRTLSRPDSFFREISVELFWDEESSLLTSVRVWQDGQYIRTEATPSTGLVQYTLSAPGQSYRWYSDSSHSITLPEGAENSDLIQRIPTYEDVLNLDPAEITAAGYVLQEEMACIYVETAPSETAVMRYWISIRSGLLAGAERLENGQTVYRMASYQASETPCPSDADFSLPEGTVLHTVTH